MRRVPARRRGPDGTSVHLVPAGVPPRFAAAARGKHPFSRARMEKHHGEPQDRTDSRRRRVSALRAQRLRRDTLPHGGKRVDGGAGRGSGRSGRPKRPPARPDRRDVPARRTQRQGRWRRVGPVARLQLDRLHHLQRHRLHGGERHAARPAAVRRRRRADAGGGAGGARGLYRVLRPVLRQRGRGGGIPGPSPDRTDGPRRRGGREAVLRPRGRPAHPHPRDRRRHEGRPHPPGRLGASASSCSRTATSSGAASSGTGSGTTAAPAPGSYTRPPVT